MPLPRLRVIHMKDIQIQRQGNAAIFVFRDRKQGSIHMTVGPKIKKMSDKQLLDLYNEDVRARQRLARSYKHVATEIVGRPQIKYSKESYTWVPQGNVLRCRIGCEDIREPRILIDDNELSLQEFGELLMVYEGWGMRIVFVPEDELHKIPSIRLKPGKDDNS